MKINGTCLLVCLVLFSLCLYQCEGKDKHRHDKHKKNEQHNSHQNQHKSTTAAHHTNHTSLHDSHDDKSHQQHNASHVGWSLHSPNPQSHPPPSNPNGYALHHHESSHDSHHQQTHHQPHETHHHPAPQGHQTMNQHPHDGHYQQPHETHHHPAPQGHQTMSQQPQDSGPSPLATGLGGFALGAVGGAAGGYLLSNALNSDDGDGDKLSESETTTILSTLLTQDISTTLADSVTTVSTDSVSHTGSESSTLIAESSDVEMKNVTDTATIDINPLEVVTVATDSPVLEAKAAQKLEVPAETLETTTANSTQVNFATTQKLSFNILVISVLLLIAKSI